MTDQVPMDTRRLVEELQGQILALSNRCVQKEIELYQRDSSIAAKNEEISDLQAEIDDMKKKMAKASKANVSAEDEPAKKPKLAKPIQNDMEKPNGQDKTAN